jgi:hypothetical protein
VGPPSTLLRLYKLREAERLAGADARTRFNRQKAQAAARRKQGPEREKLEALASKMPPSLLATAYDLAPVEQALLHYRATLNPIFAMAALARWPVGKDIPDDLQDYLRESFREIVMDAEKILNEDETMTPEQALKRAPDHLGLVGGPGARSGAFAGYRDYLLGNWDDKDLAVHALSLYTETYAEKPRAKAKDLYPICAERMGVSTARFRRLLTLARHLGGKERKRRVR